MSNVIDLNEFRHKRNAEALRVAVAITEREKALYEHEQACIKLMKFYRMEKK